MNLEYCRKIVEEIAEGDYERAIGGCAYELYYAFVVHVAGHGDAALKAMAREILKADAIAFPRYRA